MSGGASEYSQKPKPPSMWGGIFGMTNEEYQALLDAAAQKPFDENAFSPDANNWVGTVRVGIDDARENKLVALGPAPPGFAGQIEGLVLLVALKKLSETPEGIKVIRDLAIEYLREVGGILKGLHLSSSANPFNCAINGYICVRVYQRLGIISAHDAIQTCAWIDHYFSEMLKKDYFKDSITGLTSMVTGLERAIPAMLPGT